MILKNDPESCRLIEEIRKMQNKILFDDQEVRREGIFNRRKKNIIFVLFV